MSAEIALPLRRLVADDITLPPGMVADDTKGRIICASLRLFAENGFAGTSIRDIAAAAGIRTATLYGHFPTKEHMLVEISEAGHAAHRRHLSDALAAVDGGAPEQLAALVRAHVRFHACYPMLAIVANVELHSLSPELAVESLRIRGASERLFTGVAQAGVDSGDFDTPDVWMAVAAIAGMGMRVANWYSAAFPKSVDDVADVYVEFALRILGAHDPQR